MSNSSLYRVSLFESEYCEIFFYDYEDEKNLVMIKGLVREDKITGERCPVENYQSAHGVLTAEDVREDALEVLEGRRNEMNATS